MILVVGSMSYGEPLKSLSKITFDIKYMFKHPEHIDLVMFTGGEDVHPKFYNGVHTHVSFVNEQRDLFEKKIFEFCTQHGIKITGICRGFQFVNVMSGGFMYQHITNHGGFHDAYFPCDDTVRQVTSTHHQLVGLQENAIPIAWASPKRSQIYIGPDVQQVRAPEHEIEAAIFPNTNAMGVQYHPEMMPKNDPTRQHYTQMISNFMKMEFEDFIEKYGVRSNGRYNKAR